MWFQRAMPNLMPSQATTLFLNGSTLIPTEKQIKTSVFLIFMKNSSAKFRLRISCAALVLANLFNLRADGISEGNGATTNGIYATGKYVAFWPDGGHVIRIYVHFRPPSTNIPTISPFPRVVEESNGVKIYSDPIFDGKYFLATNSFCGFVELRDQSGDKVALLKPEVNSPEAYPDAYDLKLANRLLMEKVAYMGAPKPGCLSGMDPEQCRFHLQKYFKLEKTGDYQLTVWPKIYKRSETNRDLCERIDLPPVTIPIKWSGNSQ
jgi:hypothetical protein